MDIPIFVSRPSKLTKKQYEVALWLLGEMHSLGLQPRTLGSSDFAVESPLREVLVLARHCAGGIVLGFDRGEGRGSTPWNQLEAGILYATELPLLILADAGVSEHDGGIFGIGSSELYISAVPYDEARRPQARQSLLAWQGSVRQRYYNV